MAAGQAWLLCDGEAEAVSGAAALQIGDDAAPDTGRQPLDETRVVDEVGAVEGWAEHRRIGDLAAIAAADAAVVDRRHRIVAEGIVELLHRQRRAAGETDAGVIAGADV